MSEKQDAPVSPAGVSSFILMLCALALGAFHVRMLGEPGTLLYALVCGTASAAAIATLCLSAITPALFGTGPLRFPRTLLLPIAYCVLLLVAVSLFTTPSSALVRPPEPLEILRLWANPTVLFSLLVIQFLALTGLGALQRRREESDASR